MNDLAEILMKRKANQQLQSQNALTQILSNGGNYDEDTLQKIASGTGIPIEVLQQLGTQSVTQDRETIPRPNVVDTGDGNQVINQPARNTTVGGKTVYNIPNAEERATQAKVADINATAEPEANKEALKYSTETPYVVAREKQISNEIAIPAMKKNYEESLKVSKELQNSKEVLDQTHEIFLRGQKKTNPTPEEQDAHLTVLNNIAYHNSLIQYNDAYRALAVSSAMADKENSTRLERQTKFVNENVSKFYTKGAKGVISPKEYDADGKELQEFKAIMDASGIKYQTMTSQHTWPFSDKTTIVPVVPDIVSGNPNTVKPGVTNVTPATIPKTNQPSVGGRTPFLNNGKPQYYNGKQVFINEKGQKVY
jgi:transcriptional regulator with XRE-family HTH domain